METGGEEGGCEGEETGGNGRIVAIVVVVVVDGDVDGNSGHWRPQTVMWLILPGGDGGGDGSQGAGSIESIILYH